MSIDRDKETALWDWLRKGAARLDLPKHVQRIEDTTKSGTPDVEGCINSNSFWMELKIAYEQVRSPVIRIKTTDKQVYFALRRTQVGGLSWYFIRVGQYPNYQHFLIHGSLAEELFNKLIPLDWLHANSSVVPTCEAKQALLRASQPK